MPLEAGGDCSNTHPCTARFQGPAPALVRAPGRLPETADFGMHKDPTYCVCCDAAKEPRASEKKPSGTSTNGLTGLIPVIAGAWPSYPKVTHRFIHRHSCFVSLPSPAHRTILYPHRGKHLHVGFCTEKHPSTFARFRSTPRTKKVQMIAIKDDPASPISSKRPSNASRAMGT